MKKWLSYLYLIRRYLPQLIILCLLVSWMFVLYSLQENIDWHQAREALFTPHQTAVSQVQVYVSGAVRLPGVYAMDTSARLWQALELAGGLTNVADSEYVAQKLHLASLVTDAQTIFVPAVKGASVATSAASSVGKQAINQANQTQLEAVTGIGPVTAIKILNQLPISSWDQLKTAGISEKIITNLQQQFSL